MVESMQAINQKYDFINKRIQELPEGAEHMAKKLHMTINADIAYNLAKLVYYMSLESERRSHGQ